MEKEIDKTIKAICKQIQEMSESENITEVSIVPDMTIALAELISARKGFF